MPLPTSLEKLQTALDKCRSQFVEVGCEDVLAAVASAGTLDVDQVLHALHKGSRDQKKGTRVYILATDLKHVMDLNAKATHG